VACDVGTVRVGLSRSDATGMLAVPLPAVPAGPAAVEGVLAVVAEWDAIEVFVGLPLQLSGSEGPSASMARTWAEHLAERAMVPVRLIDERLSTVEAQRGFRSAGRSTRESRALIDSASAVVVLQSALEAERGLGQPPGQLVPRPEQERGQR
jgi:putative transcription antitermination factor YqgF